MASRTRRNDEIVQKALDTGSDLAGSASGAAVGLLIGGPPGAIAGAAVGPVIKRTLVESIRRLVTRREKIRVAATFAFAVTACEERLQAGDKLRDDRFFSPDFSGRSAADEVAEAVAVAAERSFEERKAEYLGYLLSNIAFEEGVDRWLANRVVRVAERLSWSQLIILSAVAREDVELAAVALGSDVGSWTSWGAHQEALELMNDNYIMTTPDQTPRLGLSVPNLRLEQARLGTGGRLLVDLMWLTRIPNDDVEAVLTRF